MTQNPEEWFRGRPAEGRPSEDLVVGEILRRKAADHPGRIFLKFREGALSYGEVDAVSDRMAAGFAARGVRPGDHVAVMLPNGPDFLHVTFALAKLGAVLVPINVAYKADILRHVLETSDSTFLVVDETLMGQAAPVLGETARIAAVAVRTEGSVPAVRAFSQPVFPLRDLLATRHDAPRVVVRHGDLQAIMYTSGTTGPSKGVMVPHALALIDAEDSIRYLDYQPGETVYCPLPLFHAGALWDGVFVALLLGSPIAIVERFSASRFWDDVRRFDARVAMGIFSMIPILLKKPPAAEDRDHPLRAFYLGKSVLDEELYARFGVRSVETYTSTEAGIGTGSPYGQWRTSWTAEVDRASPGRSCCGRCVRSRSPPGTTTTASTRCGAFAISGSTPATWATAIATVISIFSNGRRT